MIAPALVRWRYTSLYGVLLRQIDISNPTISKSFAGGQPQPCRECRSICA